MKKFIQTILVLLLFITTANAQVIRPFAARYYNPSVRGNIVYVSNSIISTSGVGAGSPGTGEIPPAGGTRNNVGNGINIDVDDPPPTTKLAFGTVWNYHTAAAAPVNNPAPTDWKQTTYIMPAAWNVGALPVGGAAKYGYNSGQATCLKSSAAATSCTPGAVVKYTAYYFRNTVNFTALELSTTFYNIQLNLLRNDGIVVYVNGVERIRDNMPGGAVVFGTLASADIVPGPAEAVSYNLSPAFFNTGANTIAVEVHLRTTTSTNMSFDMQVLGYSHGGTFNSSTSDLNLPSCSQVLFAGLYWGADRGSSGTDSTWQTAGFNTCKLKIPGAGAYTTVTSTQTDKASNAYNAGLGHTGYFCFKDITSLINTLNPNGTYAVADVVAPIGLANASGGWTIVIAYSNSVLQPRNLSVFDGNVIINLGDPPVDLPISGFLTPPVPAAVSCELGTVVYDGDRSGQDSFAFKQFGGAFYNLATAAVPLNGAQDAFNSKISYKGAVVATRNPAFQNTLGYDASIFDLPNGGNVELGNSKTSATIRFSSPNENYFVHVVTTSISQYNPAYSFDKTATDLNGGTLAPGDDIRYQINYSNVGNDASTNTVILDNIPMGTSFVPGSLKINGVAKTDVTGDDQSDYDLTNNRVIFRIGAGASALAGGTVNSASSGNVQFDVKVTPSCNILTCIGTIANKASISYRGLVSGAALVDTSGVNISGCIIAPFAVTLTPAGVCFTPSDTLIINKCPVTSATIPYTKYAGYQIYSAQPFIAANLYNPVTPVTVSHVYWAYFSNGAGCSDTIKINMIITPCPDIDDDNDGIPDYVEFNNVLATQDVNGNGIPNWNDNSYPGYIDNNTDNVNDNFDWGADADNDGIPNFRDNTFWIAWVDVNGDGINDRSDRDLDGIPNQYDLDSDNDGIPDVTESYGVDANGDGRIDNYTDTDNDGFSQNVDFNNTGVTGSRSGLDAQDLDGDGIPNYLDADSDNDGIPDVIEAGGTDANNDGVIDGYVDVDGDGFSDPVDGDVGNDNIAENAANTLLRTGPDTTPVNGRADTYPYKNMDNDLRANPYDLDSDGDGILDVWEAGFVDSNFNGFIDGAIGADGWSTAVNALATLILPNTDTRGNPDYLDIDADDDGIPDNVEGQTTASYKFPLGTDTDNDGIDGNYDAVVGFGGSGIFLSDKDGDGAPDYRDLDTDADGRPDIIEGNDFNLNAMSDDNVSLTLLDTDGDGLDNRFDSLNSTINIKGTSYRMGTAGSFVGDPAPGSRTPVQRTLAAQPDRDWRYVGYVLNVQMLDLNGTAQANNVMLNWGIISPVNIDRFEIERSIDNITFNKIGSVAGNFTINELHNFTANDNISNINYQLIYYRLKVIPTSGQPRYSNVLAIRKIISKTIVRVQPNPASNATSILFFAEKESEVSIRLIDAVGKTVLFNKQRVSKGNNVIQLNELSKYNNAVYSLQIVVNDELVTQKLIIQNK
ncbi:MAG: T9SS type A sorting domain-containing protein [Ferruginibacter sp.]